MEDEKTSSEKKITFIDYVILVLKRKKLILSVTLGSAVITAVLVFIMHDRFIAETRFLPPASSSSGAASAMLSQLGGIAGLAAGTLTGTTPDLYSSLLISRTVLDKVIDRFGLMKRYNNNWFFPFRREDARSVLTDDIMVTTVDEKSGVISLTIEDDDPTFAAQMANGFMDELKALHKGLALTESSQRKLYFGEQAKSAKENLTKAEDELRGFQEKTGMLSLDAQARAVIEGIAMARASIAAKEVEIGVLRTFATPQNPDLQKAEDALRSLKAEAAKLETKGGSSPEPLMPTGRIPSEGVELVRKMRDVKYYETLFTLLSQQYEMARVDEARGDAAVIQIVDVSIPPTKKAKPKRLLIILLVTFTAFFLSFMYVLVAENIRKSKELPEINQKYDTAYRLFRFWKKTAQTGKSG